MTLHISETGRLKNSEKHIVSSCLEALFKTICSAVGVCVCVCVRSLGEHKSLYLLPPESTRGVWMARRWAARFNQPASRLASNPRFLRICKRLFLGSCASLHRGVCARNSRECVVKRAACRWRNDAITSDSG